MSSLLDVQAGLKIDPSAVARLEKGGRSIRLNEAVALAAIFDSTVDQMLRAALPRAEQLREAERRVAWTRDMANAARVEHEVAVERAKRLRELLGGEPDGERRETP